jgi:GNT-I family
LSPATYEHEYMDLVRHSQHVTSVEEGLDIVSKGNVVIPYAGFPDFQDMARQLGLMADEKAGIPRTAFKGIVETRPHGDHFLFLVPIDVL